jgi:twinfilin-like protein
MALVSTGNANGDWEKDWDTVVKPMLDDKTPRFVLYRLDSRSKVGWEWVVLEWIPDGAKVNPAQHHPRCFVFAQLRSPL